ncbi:uncharacterized protein LOC116001288 [Ipomoea triloba]|uniref:uncharacterized protein LOC116001288 n=1 Tax=Ipomoea triloba TaxID=35885 RepID=UPI00125D4580|nr:uncharacterized protein LOC116001288 [Ipomoea triloba]
MAENNRAGQQDERIPPIVPPPQNQAAQPRLRDIQRPVIAVNPCCIQLSDAARNYELKSFHLNMLPTFNGLGSEDALGFMRELYSTSHRNHLMKRQITWDLIWGGNHQEMIHFPIHIIQVGEITLTSHGEIKVMQGQWDHLDFSNKGHQDLNISNTDPSSSHLHHNNLNFLLRRKRLN